MNPLVPVIGSALLLFLAYRFYGNLLMRWLKPDDRSTPAHEFNDGNDFCPANAGVLTGQHFTAIAAAGPIVGPILAGLYFGWGPALCWILLGSIFVGGAHDAGSLFASVRHKACSIAEVVRQRMPRSAYLVFLVFIWLSLVYVIIAFADLTASQFAKDTVVAIPGENGTTKHLTVLGGGVATAAQAYLLVSMALGVGQRFFKMPAWLAFGLGVPVVGLTIWFGQHFPIPLASAKSWDMIVLFYCLLASVLPMWLLLQPRGMLGAIFLYAVIAIGLAGNLFGGLTGALKIESAPFRGAATAGLPGPLIPFLFITIACGACSGFHSIVASGTTSKQLNCEQDIKPVAYGAMMLEAMLAVLALTTIMVVPHMEDRKPDEIFAIGLGRFAGLFGVPVEFVITFGLLAFSTFVFDTIDVCTRLGRYVFQEFFGISGFSAGAIATLCTLAFPTVYLLISPENAWKQFWTIFGTSNQLLAALTLIGLSVWFRAIGRNPWPVLAPAFFMLGVTGVALAYNLAGFAQILWGGLPLPKGTSIGTVWVNFSVAGLLAALAVFVSIQGFNALRRPVSLEPSV